MRHECVLNMNVPEGGEGCGAGTGRTMHVCVCMCVKGQAGSLIFALGIPRLCSHFRIM